MVRKRHPFRHLMLLVLLAAALALIWVYVSPLMSSTAQPVYAAYTVERGDIATSKSFSATISVLHSETFANTSGASGIREVYVQAGQEVREGDQLMLLSDGTLLEASLDGVVNEMRYTVGDWLRQGTQLIQVCDLTHLQVSLSVDEYDVRGVRPGQSCTVTIVPLGLDFETQIAHVDRVSSATGQVAYYTATAELTVPENVLPGMTASVTMPDQAVSDVLVLDMAALNFDDDRSPYVLVKNGDDYTPTPVVTGLSDGMRVEIVSGLTLGDTVWAETGTETAQSPFSLTEVYKKIFGEKIVINNIGSSFGSSGRGSRTGWGNQGASGESAGMDSPSPFGEPPGGFTMPDGNATPEGFARPEGLATPGDMPPTRQRDSEGNEGSETTDRPQRPNQEREERP